MRRPMRSPATFFPSMGEHPRTIGLSVRAYDVVVDRPLLAVTSAQALTDCKMGHRRIGYDHNRASVPNLVVQMDHILVEKTDAS